MWEYEALFDAEAGKDPDRWKTEQTSARVGQMQYRTKTTKAGPRLEAEIYPIFGRQKSAEAKAARSKVTPLAMQRLNEERSKRYLIQLADANFTRSDISLTLTYKGTPPSYEDAQKDVRNFLARVKRKRVREGLDELKYIYVIEDNQDGKKKRIHVHMILNGGIARDDLEKIWAKGYANADRLQPDENGLEALVRYMTKQHRNRRKWVASRNLKKPKTRVSDTKVSRSRVRRIASDFLQQARDVMEKVYPGYRFVTAKVYFSDVIDGVYIRCVMRKKKGDPDDD